MGASTSQGTGPGSVTKEKPPIFNGVVRTENIASDAVVTSDVLDGSVTTAKIDDGAVTTVKIVANAVTTSKIADSNVTTAKIAADAVTTPKMKFFKSSEQTGSGSAQNVAHGLGATPGLVMIFPTDAGSTFTVSEGSHDSTNVVVTVANAKKYKVVAFV